jgi:hypothetical protein
MAAQSRWQPPWLDYLEAGLLRWWYWCFFYGGGAAVGAASWSPE